MKQITVAALLCAFMCANSQAQTLSGKRKNVLYNITETGMLYGVDDAGFNIKTVLGYRFLSRYSVGAGIGYQDYFSLPPTTKEWPGKSIAVMPVFLDLRYFFLDGKVSPFVYGNPGLLHLISMDVSGVEWKRDGWTPSFEGGAGLEARWNQRNAFLVSVGYVYNEASGSYLSPTTTMTRPERLEYTLRRLTVKVGLTF